MNRAYLDYDVIRNTFAVSMHFLGYVGVGRIEGGGKARGKGERERETDRHTDRHPVCA